MADQIKRLIFKYALPILSFMASIGLYHTALIGGAALIPASLIYFSIYFLYKNNEEKRTKYQKHLTTGFAVSILLGAGYELLFVPPTKIASLPEQIQYPDNHHDESPNPERPLKIHPSNLIGTYGGVLEVPQGNSEYFTFEITNVILESPTNRVFLFIHKGRKGLYKEKITGFYNPYLKELRITEPETEQAMIFTVTKEDNKMRLELKENPLHFMRKENGK